MAGGQFLTWVESTGLVHFQAKTLTADEYNIIKAKQPSTVHYMAHRSGETICGIKTSKKPVVTGNSKKATCPLCVRLFKKK